MEKDRSLSPLPDSLMVATAAAFGLVGLLLFVAPAWSAAGFPWKISPLVAMTMGGWYLGNAVMAGLVAHYRRWSLIYASALNLSVFGVAEAAVVVIHSDKLRLAAPLAWPYIAMLALAVLTALFVWLDWARWRPTIADEGSAAPRWVRAIIVLFVLLVFFLAGVAFSGHRVGLQGVIFPEPLTLFTLRAFGAFYFALACSAVALLHARRLGTITLHVKGGGALIVLITAAAFVYWPSFNFAEHPYQSLYLGVYLAALAAVIYYMWEQRGHLG